MLPWLRLPGRTTRLISAAGVSRTSESSTRGAQSECVGTVQPSVIAVSTVLEGTSPFSTSLSSALRTVLGGRSIETAGGSPRATCTIVDAVPSFAPSADLARQVKVYSIPVSSVKSVSAERDHRPPLLSSVLPASSAELQGSPPSPVQLISKLRLDSG